MVESNRTYVGVVEDNNDPKRLGRVKVRVLDVFDNLEVEDIPFATAWKDLNGNMYNTPDIGKVVIIVFDQGNIESPEYIYADNYNINLENKLKKLSSSDYISMKSLLFDHKTQIYVNDSEGLKIDHKFNNINILDGSINLNLKDNNTNLNLGDSTASQQAVLGNHFMNWMEKFLKTLENGGLMNSGGPVKPDPRMIKLITEFKAFKDIKFLSHHVNIVDNNKVSTVLNNERENVPQIGDNWLSTKNGNTLSYIEQVDYEPSSGLKQDYDPNYIPPSTNGEPDSTTQDIQYPVSDLTKPESLPLINKLIKFMKSKGYVVYEEPNLLNIVSIRSKDDGKITNKFDEIMYVFYKNNKNEWVINEYTITTTPGFKPKSKQLPKKVAVLTLGQYVDQYKLGFHQNKPDHKCLKFATSIVHRNNKDESYDFASITEKGAFGINIHRSSKNGSSENVFNWSEGCQVFKNSNQFTQFINLCEIQSNIKNTFTYTLCRKSEFDNYKL